MLSTIKSIFLNETIVIHLPNKKETNEPKPIQSTIDDERKPIISSDHEDMFDTDNKKEEKEEKEDENQKNVRVYTKYSFLFIFLFAFYRFTFQMMLTFITQVQIQKDIEFLVGPEKKTTVLGNLLGGVSMIYIFGPLIGYISDRTPMLKIWKIDIGKRKPYIFLGMLIYFATFMARPFLLVKDSNIHLIIYCILAVVGSFASCWSVVAFTAMFPDIFHPSQYNIVAGLISVGSLVGQTAGTGIFGLLWTYLDEWINVLIMTIIGVIGVLPIFLFSETKNKPKLQRKKLKSAFKYLPLKHKLIVIFNYLFQFVTPFFHWNYSMVFFSRFISMFGLAIIQGFMLYFLKDVVQTYEILHWKGIITSETEANAILSYVQFFFGLICAFFFPLISQYITRKFTVFIAVAMMNIAFFAFILSREYTVLLIFSSLYGGGLAGWNALYFALVTVCLPNKKKAGKDLSLFSLANIVPISICSPLVGSLIKWGNSLFERGIVVWDNFGYHLSFYLAILCLMIGSLLVAMIKTNKKKELN